MPANKNKRRYQKRRQREARKRERRYVARRVRMVTERLHPPIQKPPMPEFNWPGDHDDLVTSVMLSMGTNLHTPNPRTSIFLGNMGV